MDQSKPWYASKTVWGSLVGGAGLVTAYLGYRVDPATQAVLVDQTTAAVVAVAALASTVLTLVGRFRATKTVR